jgi:hypothetical protein
MLDNVKRRFRDIKDRVLLHGSYRRIFDSPDGARVLTHIMKVGHVTSTTFVPGDPHMTAMNEGKRLLALSILRFVGTEHKKLIEQVEETLTHED